MIIIIVCIVVLIIGLVIMKYQDSYDIGGWVTMFVGGTALFLCLITAAINCYDVLSKIEAFKATQKTITVAREAKNDFESATLQLQVIESNKWLAKTKYWNDTIFDIWIPDDINDIEFIK